MLGGIQQLRERTDGKRGEEAIASVLLAESEWTLQRGEIARGRAERQTWDTREA